MALINPAFLDTKTYGFEWLRYLLDVAPLQEGVIGAGDYKVTAAAAGGMRVDIAAGTALVQADTGVRNGKYVLVNDASVANALTFDASDATNPRIDQAYVIINDSSDLGSLGDVPAFGISKGTATAGATLDNRTGAAALPNNALRLADVLIPAVSSAVSAGNVRDRRAWARGAFRRLFVTGAAWSVTTSSMAVVDSVRLAARLELGGGPVCITFISRINGAVGQRIRVGFFDNAVGVNGGTPDGHLFGPSGVGTLDFYSGQPISDVYIPTVGTHLLDVRAMYEGGGNASISSDPAAVLIIEELIRQNADNT